MNRQQAVREMFQLIQTAIGSLVTVINYPNRPETKPDASAAWARVQLIHVEAEQRSIVAVNQLYENEGNLIIQLFEPSGRGLAQDTLTQPMLSALRAKSTPGACWFRRVTSKENGISEHWHQTNVSCIFQYDSRENQP